MNDTIAAIISVLTQNGVNAVYGDRHDKADRPVSGGKVYVYPEKIKAGMLYIAADVYSPFDNDLSECMRIAESTAKLISSSVSTRELNVSKLDYDRNAMGYVSRVTFCTPYEDSGGVSIRFFGFGGDDELFINAEVFDIMPVTEFMPHPIYTVFCDMPEDVVYDSVKYTITLYGVRGGLGNLLASYGLFDMGITKGGEEFCLRRCSVLKSDEPYGSTLTVVGYLSEE